VEIEKNQKINKIPCQHATSSLLPNQMLTIGCGGKPRNLYITSGSLQVFFFMGGEPKVHQMTGVKVI